MMRQRFVRLALILLVSCAALMMLARGIGTILPAGAQLAFAVRKDDNNATMYLIDLARDLTVPLASNVYDRTISFAPDGTLVFSRYTNNQHNTIFRMDSNGHEIQLSPDGVRDEYPLWSPDGTQVAFFNYNANTSFVTLFVMNGDGSNRRDLSQRIEPHANAYPTWLPDSQHIMYATLGLGQNATFIVNTLTGERLDFTYTTGISPLPIWSPDGTQIIYVVTTPRYATLYASEVDANGQVVLGTRHTVLSGTGTFNSLRWSPDSSRILYVSGFNGNSDIFVTGSDGLNTRNLSQHPAGDTQPVWSPDGSQIAFISRRDGSPQIYVMNADGTNQRRITSHHEDDGQLSAPAWMP
jgi:Tol biopolymer transport system component